MNNVALQKQQYREFHRSLYADGELISIRYYMQRPNDTNTNWTQANGVMWQIDGILALHKIITPLTFSDGSVASTIISKGDWFVPYQGLDFYGDFKRYFKIIDRNGQIYEIDKVIPFGKYGNGYISWKFIAK